MNASLLILLPVALLLGAGAWILFMWAVRRGHYEDMEGPKYRMLDEESDEERTRRERGGGPPPKNN